MPHPKVITYKLSYPTYTCILWIENKCIPSTDKCTLSPHNNICANCGSYNIFNFGYISPYCLDCGVPI